ncbi:D-lactate dehydrogenase [uncultured Psychrobacter sp.]|uniref:D-lactate dehydrogenase n=1 Tax=uncultured Psychrobacter sp. TaxID=259303 RepID=UPI003458D235
MVSPTNNLSAFSLSALLTDFKGVVAADHVLTKPSQQQAYVQGMIDNNYEDGNGTAILPVVAVVIPQSLVELWRVINICAKADVIIIAQAANTGLTGGSTPYGKYDRPVVMISMQALTGIYLLSGGAEVVALPAATLQELEYKLAPLGREPHSVLGSSCVGASIIGGICNSSGGMLVQRGPAYTEMALFARRNAEGHFELINNLGVDLGDEPEQMLDNLQKGQFNKTLDSSKVNNNNDRKNSNRQYQTKVRDCDADTPARFNNDPSGLYEASGSAGKLIVFAVRVATYPKTAQEQTFYISTNNADTLTKLRQGWLKSTLNLPILAEYMHKEYNDITLTYGRDTCLSMRKLSADKIGALYRLQAKINYHLDKWHLPKTLPDRVLQLASNFMPTSLPKTLIKQAITNQYHLIIKVADDDIESAHEFLRSHLQQHQGTLHLCTDEESQALLVFRSAATAAMFRYHNLHSKDFGALLSTDIALPRNAVDWDEKLPAHLQKKVSKTFYLGHFFCHVMHQDYLLHASINTDIDTKTFKDELLAFYDQRRIEYPAEHNVGHIYTAKPELHEFYKELDPTNSLNPGIGQAVKGKNWRSSPNLEE